MNIETLFTDLETIFPEMVKIRRDLHQHPEIAFQEVRTPKLIADYLTELDIEVRTGVGGRGVVGLLKGGKEGKTVALRADFDALPIQDEKDVAYKSTVPGEMHACGHDGHTATLLGVATVLAKHRDKLAGNVVFIHQFAEEKAPGGAKPMIADGCLDGVDVIFGAHLQSMLPLGQVSYCEGYSSAATDRFEIKIIGNGGHGAYPHDAIDPLVTGGQLIVNLQQIVSRSVDPIKAAVLTIGSFHSGEGAHNVIPHTAELVGTVRTYDPQIRDLIEKRMEEIIAGTCQTSGATFELNYHRGYDALWNHAKETKYIKEIASNIVGNENVINTPPSMGAEDFSYYVNEIPGTFYNIGARLSDESKVYPHHHPCFDFDEQAMIVGAKVFISAVINLNEKYS